jgi:putative hemolysin
VIAIFFVALVIAWLTAASIAVRAVSRIWLRHWVEGRPKGFHVAERYLEGPTRLLVAASAGSALALVIAGALAARMVAVGTRAAIALAGVALTILLVGHILPRAVARRWAAGLLPVLLPPLRAVEIALAPIVALSRWVEKRLQADRQAPDLERDGLEDLLREGELEGVGEGDEIAIITGVVRFGEKTLREVMTPRAEVFALDDSLPAPEIASRIAESAYTRVPITHGNSLDQIVGMVHAFDILRADGEKPQIRPVPSAPGDMRCNELLFRMLRARQHLAIVRNVTGDTAGIVTLEDLLEELVGDIRDEHDDQPPVTRAVSHP